MISRRNNIPFPEIFALVLLAFMLYRLLLAEPIIGLADHGDYFRIMNKVGLRWLTDIPEERYYWYVNRHFGYTAPTPEIYFSSETYLAWIAVGLDNILTGDDYFSITAIGAVHAVLFLIGVGLILFGLRTLPVTSRILLASLIVFFYGDVGYVAWFNSLYSEPASQIFLFISIGLALLLIKDRVTDRRRWILGAMYYLAVFLFLTAKPQNGPCGIVMVVMGYWLTMNPVGSKRKIWVMTAAALPGVMLLALSGWLTLVGQPEYMKHANIYDAVFADLLKYSPSPQSDMKELDIDEPKFIPLIGLDYYTINNPMIKTPEFKKEFYDRIGYGKILRFYWRHPLRFYRLIDRVSNWSYTMRPLSMGNYEHSAAPITTNSHGVHQRPAIPILSMTFSAWSRLKDRIFPHSALFLIAFFLVNLGFSLARLTWPHVDQHSQGYALVHLVITLMAGLQFFAAVVGQGESSIVKHLHLFNILFDGMAIILTIYLCWIIGTKKWRHRVRFLLQAVKM